MSDPVQDTITRTQERLSTGFFNPVTRDEVLSIAADLDALTPSQRQQVIEGLSDEDLDKLAGEIMDTTPIIGGLNADERQALFADFAVGLDGEQLGRIAEAFATTGGNTEGFTPIDQLAAAVALHSGVRQKLEFIEQLAPLTTDNPSFYTTNFGSVTTTGSDAEASAVGAVIASMQGQSVTRALSLLDDQQLQAVIDSSVQVNTFQAGRGGMTLTWNTGSYEAIMDAVATARSVGGTSPLDSAEQRARVFDAAGNALAEIDSTNSVIGGLVVVGKDDAMASVTQGMTQVLQSDTTGIVTELTYDQRFDEGTAMTAYAKAMLNSGGVEKLAEIMLQLQMGNDGTQNPVDRLEEQIDLGGGRTINANAGALGYFVGSVYAATGQISSNIADQQTLITAVLKSTLTVIDKSKVGGPLAGMVAAVAKEWVGIGVEMALDDPGAGPAQRLEDAAIPADPATNNRAISDAANSAFDDSISKVRRNN